MPIVSRNNARVAGSSRYLTGKVCLYGHEAERYVSTGACVECVRAGSQRLCQEGTRFYLRIAPEFRASVAALGWWIVEVKRAKWGRHTFVVEAPQGTTSEEVDRLGLLLGWWA